METEKIIDEIQAKILEIHNEASDGLAMLNKNAEGKNYGYDGSMFSLDDSYFREVAIYAWGYRGSQIAAIKMQGLLTKLKKELKKPNNETREFK